jgi:hypothetical protein
LMALLPFKNPTISDTDYFGGIDNTRWTWSFCTLPSNPSIFFHSHSCLIISRADLPTSPVKILNLYFGHHTKWYLQSYTACANLLNLPIEYLLFLLESPIYYIKEVFILYKLNPLPYLHCIAVTHLHSRWFKVLLN